MSLKEKIKSLKMQRTTAMMVATFLAVQTGLIDTAEAKSISEEALETEKLYPRHSIEQIIDYEADHGQVSTIVDDDIYSRKNYDSIERVDLLLEMLALSEDLGNDRKLDKKEKAIVKERCERILKNSSFISDINDKKYITIYREIKSFTEDEGNTHDLMVQVNWWLIKSGYKIAYDYCNTVILWELQSVDPNVKSFQVINTEDPDDSSLTIPVVYTFPEKKKLKFDDDEILRIYKDLESNVSKSKYSSEYKYKVSRNNLLSDAVSKTTLKLFEQLSLSKDKKILKSELSGRFKRKIARSVEKDLKKNGSTVQGIDYTAYTIKPGDNLITLANKYGFSLELFCDLNPDIEDLQNIKVGQVVILPIVPDKYKSRSTLQGESLNEEESKKYIIDDKKKKDDSESKKTKSDVVISFDEALETNGYARGVDVSQLNGSINWPKLADEMDLSFAIVRGFTVRNGKFQEDELFEENFKECAELGLPIGVYTFVNFDLNKCEAQANQIADRIEELCEKYGIEYIELPIYLDFEEKAHVNNKDRVEIIEKVLSTWESRGFFAGIYTDSAKRSKLDEEAPSLRKYDTFYARYKKQNSSASSGTSQPFNLEDIIPTPFPDKGYDGATNIVQNYDNVELEVISPNANGLIDIDFAYVNYPELVKKHKNKNTQVTSQENYDDGSVGLTMEVDGNEYYTHNGGKAEARKKGRIT